MPAPIQTIHFRPTERAVASTLQDGSLGEPSYATIVHHRHRPEVGAFTMDHPMLWEMSVHHFDSILAMFGRAPLRACARSFNPPWSKYPGLAAVQTLIELEGPVYVSYVGTFTSHNEVWENRVECENGALVWGPQAPLHVLSPGGRELRQVPLPAETRTDTQQIVDQFFAYVTEGAEPGISGRRNLATLRLVDASVRSSTENRIVHL